MKKGEFLIDKNIKKYKQVKVNFLPEQHQILTNLATEKNMTIAQFIREKLNLNLDENRAMYKKHKQVVYKDSDPKLIYELNRIGNNLNQIARVVNTKKTDYNSVEILKSLNEIQQMVKSLL